MRYTTIIDISEYPVIYRNINVRLLYLHLVLKSGYHENDRDIADTSLRRLQGETGLTLSAIRHAVKILERSNLISRQGSLINVKKFVLSETIEPRPKNKRQERAAAVKQEREQQAVRDAEEKALKERMMAEMKETGKTPFMRYYEDLERKAAEGDLDAAEKVKQHRQTYEMHRSQMSKK